MALDFLLFYLWGVLQNRPTLGAERRFRPVRLPALALPRQGAPGFYETPPAGGEMAKVSAFHARVYHIPTLSASLYRKERESVEMLENLRILPSAPARVYHTRPCPAYGKPCVFSFTTTYGIVASRLVFLSERKRTAIRGRPTAAGTPRAGARPYRTQGTDRRRYTVGSCVHAKNRACRQALFDPPA